MAYDEERVVTRTEERAGGTAVPPAYPPAYPPAVGTGYSGSRVTETAVGYRESRGRFAERLVIFLFGIVQLLILLRLVLLLIAARQGNALVSFVYDITELFVAPFRGILRIDVVEAGRSALDVGAIVALIGWTLIELLILGVIRLFRPRATV